MSKQAGILHYDFELSMHEYIKNRTLVLFFDFRYQLNLARPPHIEAQTKPCQQNYSAKNAEHW